MIKKRFYSIKIVLFLFLAVYSVNGYTCRCAGNLTPKEAFENVDVVLLGTTTSISGDPYLKGGAEIYISVSKTWKNPTPDVIKVFSSTSCAFNFKYGEQYLLYLHKVKGSDYYVTTSCQGNSLVSEAGEYLSWLKKNIELYNTHSEFREVE